MSPDEPHRAWPWLGGLALLMLAMFGDTLVPGARVLGDPPSDMLTHSLPWRAFGFGELAKGNLALWNPHVFAGAPYFGGLQSALLYPPNLLFLVLPLPLAMNWGLALDFWLLGAFMFLWARRRGLAPFAAFVCSALVILCAPHFWRVLIGGTAAAGVMAWAPLLFLCIDEWLETRRPLWCLLGMLAVAMQIFAGQPQYVYYIAIIAAIFSALRLLEAREGRLQVAVGLLSLHAGGALLGAAQMLPALQVTAETVRGQPLPYEFAAAYSFPPENFITLLAPGFFGDGHSQPYWGRWFLPEASAFMGVIGLSLAVYGFGAARIAGKWALLCAAAAAAMLALGDNTPLYRPLYEWLPWFDKFRLTTRFLFPAMMILALFAGYGLDRLLRERALSARALWGAGVSVSALLVAAVAVRALEWPPFFNAIIRTGESFADGAFYGDQAGVLSAQVFASRSLLLAGVTLAAAAGLALWLRRERRAALLLGALAVAEAFAFARMQRPTFDPAAAKLPELGRFLAGQPGDYRILNLVYPNSGIFTGARDAWGYDPAIERRYAELIHWSVGNDPASATMQVEFKQFHPLLAMLRVKYVVELQLKDKLMTIAPGALPPLRQVELVGAYQVRVGRDAVLGALGAPSFDPRKEVILEHEPHPAPVASANPGRAAVVRQDTDWLEIEAEVASPSILLVTDAWSPAWRARPLKGSAASHYEVMPANHALRAVPLGAGKHRLRLEYAPAAVPAGLIVSLLAWSAWIGAVFFLRRRERMQHRA
jgi:hypothetical protein